MNTLLDLALNFFNLFLGSGVGMTPHSRLLKFRFEFQVHLDLISLQETGGGSAPNTSS